MRNFIQITITKKGENRARMGHPWVFEGEVLKESEKPENGSLVDVVSEKGKYIGTGFYNDHSKIRVRLLSYNANDRFDEAFFERRVRYAVDYRKTVMPGADFACCRLIFGEADGFPGLTVDRFDDVLVAQVLSLGMERHKNQIFSLLLRVLREMGERVKGVYERNDVKIRELEGMSEKKGIAQIPENELTEADLMPIIVENGLSYMVDVVNGQKTVVLNIHIHLPLCVSCLLHYTLSVLSVSSDSSLLSVSFFSSASSAALRISLRRSMYLFKLFTVSFARKDFS